MVLVVLHVKPIIAMTANVVKEMTANHDFHCTRDWDFPECKS